MSPADTSSYPAAPAPGKADGAEAAYGLFPAAAFTITTGDHAAGRALPQALWYFRQETVAVPQPGARVAGFARGVPTFADLQSWAAALGDTPPDDAPPLVWVGAPDVLRGVRIAADARSLETPAGRVRLELVPRHPLNRSYVDASSFTFFRSRTVTLRGTAFPDRFVARTIWPEDFVLRSAPPLRALPDGQEIAALRARMREAPQGGARAPFTACTLWQRNPPSDWAGRPVLAFIVNGAQGDDDEAHAGHFAIVTGRVSADGHIGDWLTNNFYTLDSESEKGIIAAPVPLDNYLGDLNSGQAWYRPSHLLVAVLDDARAARLVQSALGRVYNQLYRHQIVYYHPCINCTSMSLDTLDALGWSVPGRGPSGRLRAWLGLPWLLAREHDIDAARRLSDYLATDVTRMLPAAAFEEIVASLLALVQGKVAGTGRLAQWLAQDVAALALLSLPQFPSSRAFGDAPVVSLAEYDARLPADRRKLQIVPVPARPFPAALRDGDLLPPPRSPADIALSAWRVTAAALAIALVVWITLRLS
jgi:hypothetical protein